MEASGGSLSLTLVTGSNTGSRSYLMASDSKYQMFHLKNKEFTFDVDVSNLPWGLNGALYFVEMVRVLLGIMSYEATANYFQYN